MSQAAIEVKNLSKRYRLGETGATSLRDELNTWWGQLRGTEQPKDKSEFWALRDVSFTVQPGEVVGIVGRNGAGKSTLLKILSRITEPTEGLIRLRGSVSSLLEVGTGFHPDLTGRDNIFLNGAILGMSRVQVRRKLEEIIAFSEIEQFIDTAVKRYSSGMSMRLAFAVAAHLEPDILILDEVLAVGDAKFQRKCLGKMGEVAKQGRTILFVSHNLAAVSALCSRAISFNLGTKELDGRPSEVLSNYLASAVDQSASKDWGDLSLAPGTSELRVKHVRVGTPSGEAATIDTGVKIEIGFYNKIERANLDVTIYLYHQDGTLLFESGVCLTEYDNSKRGNYETHTIIPPHLLNAGRFYLNVVFGRDQQHVIYRMDEVVSFDIENTATHRRANLAQAPGVIRPFLKWHQIFSPSSTEFY